jgi:glutathione synthase/RimK-type ligase-like ATP-grasp enzyme
VLKKLRKTMAYGRLRQYLPMAEPRAVDDSGAMGEAEVVLIDWPQDVAKPRIGIVKDLDRVPRWTKYRRFLETNGFPYEIYDLHAHDWIEKAAPLDAVINIVSNDFDRLEETRVKYHFLERSLGKRCYPSAGQVRLYENKSLEAFIAAGCGLPFAKTFVSHAREDALAMIETARYPLVSKIDYSSGSMGVELVPDVRGARRIVRQAFSRAGRKVHVPWRRQKGYVYFQEFVPNDGFDIRVILVGDQAFGYYRRVPRGDFRASGMHTVERRGLPEEAIRVALEVQRHVRSPQLVVDMVHGLDGRYVIIEYSIICLMDRPADLQVDGVPGVYVIGGDGTIRFEKGRYWIHELALKKFLEDEFLRSGRTN